MYTIGKREINQYLKLGRISIKRYFGQNYLLSQDKIRAFINKLSEVENIIEIGPGFGNLTINYLDRFKNSDILKKVFLIEIDKESIDILKENIELHVPKTYKQEIHIIQDDFLNIDFEKLNITDEYAIIGALPYNIGKRIVNIINERFLPPPKYCVFILQREVVDKYLDEESFLYKSSSLFATLKREDILKKDCFFPIPNVDSRIIILKDFNTTDRVYLKKITNFMRKAYKYPNKKLSNNIHETKNTELGEKRPKDITVKQFISLYSSLDK